MAGDLEFAIKLTADGSGFVGNVRVARDELDKLGQQAGNAAGGSDKLNASMTESVAKGTLLADVVKDVAKQMVDFVVRAIDAGDRLNDLSIGTGRTIAELQALEVVAAKNGGSLDSMLAVIDRVAKSMNKGQDESNKFGKALDYFGISLTDASGNAKSAEQVAYELAVAYTESSKTADTAAAMQVLLGAGYAGQIPQMLGLADKQKELNSLREYGAIVDANLAKASDEYNDTMIDVRSVMAGFGNDLARAVLPLLTSLAQWFVTSSTSGGLLQGTFTVLGVAVDVVIFAFKALMATLISADALLKMVGKSVGALFAVLANPTRYKEIWNELTVDISEINATSNKALTDLWQNIDKAEQVAKPPRDRGGLIGTNTVKKEKDATVDLTAEIAKLATALDKTEAEAVGVVNETKNYDAAYSKLLGLLLDGEIVTTAQINAHLDTARALDEAEKKLKAYNKSLDEGKAYADAYWKDRNAWEAAMQKRIDDTEKLVGKMQDHNTELANEIGMIGLTIPQQIARNAELERERINTSDATTEQKKRLIELVSEKEALEQQKYAIGQNIKAWEDFNNAMRDGIRSFIDDWINGGWSTAWKNVWNRVLNWGLDVFAQWAAKQAAMSFTLVGGTPGFGGGGGGGGGGLFDSLFGGGGNLLSSGSGILATLFGDAFASAAGAGMSAGFSTLGIALEAGAGAVGGLSSVLGAATAALGPFALAAGIALPVLTSLFKSGGGPKEGGFATTGVTPGIGGTDSSGTRWVTPSTADAQMMQAVNSLNDQYRSLLRALGGTGTAVFAQGFSTDPQGSASSNVHTGVFGPGGQVFNAENANVGRSPEELKAALEQQSMQAILAALQSSELPSVVHDYLASIDVSTATAEQIRGALAHAAELKVLADAVSALPADMATNLLSAIGVSDELDIKIAEFAVSFKAFAAAAGELQDQLDRDPQAEAIKAVAAAHATTFEKVGLARDALSEMLTKYDGSTEGTKALTAATGAYIDAQVAALVEISNIKTSLDGMFGNTLRTFELALMDTKAQQGFYVDEALKTVALLKQTTDPQKIAELSKIVNDDLVSAFNLMDPKTQKEQHDYLKGILTDAQAAAGTQLDLAEQSVVDAGTQSQQILDKVQLALDEAADKQREAAQALIGAAQAIKDAAAQQQTAANTNVAAANAQAAAAVAQAAAATAQQTAADTPVAVAVTVYEASGGP